MNLICRYLLGLSVILNILHVNALDMTHLCAGVSYGSPVANPLDCASYFICTDIENPTLKNCNNGLHFDVERKVCNWPNQAKCNFGSTVYPIFSSTMPPEISGYSETNNPTSSASLAASLTWYDPVHILGAFDKVFGNQINILADFNDLRIQCVHFGVYFLPFPGHCNKYIICAFGHLYVHECGEGIRWDYLKKECSVRPETKCYGKHNAIEPELVLVYPDAAVLPGNFLPKTTTSSHISTDHCIIDIITSKQSKSTTKDLPRFSSSTPIASTTLTQTEASTENELPSCPADGRKAYLPYTYNCTKYYICILGTPVLTSCPNSLYWNQVGEFCTSEATNNCTMLKPF